jgi:hypothetical protein
MKNDIIHSFYHKSLGEELLRVKKNLENMGLYFSKKELTALIAEKSRRFIMNEAEIKEFHKKLRNGK